MKIGNSQSGFTLIEAVVAVSVFAITITSILGVYVSVQRLNRDSRALQAIQQNGRFVSEDITKIIRNGQIDYDSYPADRVPKPFATDLFLADVDGEQVRIFPQGETLMISRSGRTSQLTGNEIKMRDFRVYIWPQTDPFLSGASVRHQPTVTIFMDLESNIANRDSLRIPFQITAATKQYPIVE